MLLKLQNIGKPCACAFLSFFGLSLFELFLYFFLVFHFFLSVFLVSFANRDFWSAYIGKISQPLFATFFATHEKENKKRQAYRHQKTLNIVYFDGYKLVF